MLNRDLRVVGCLYGLYLVQGPHGQFLADKAATLETCPILELDPPPHYSCFEVLLSTNTRQNMNFGFRIFWGAKILADQAYFQTVYDKYIPNHLRCQCGFN